MTESRKPTLIVGGTGKTGRRVAENRANEQQPQQILTPLTREHAQADHVSQGQPDEHDGEPAQKHERGRVFGPVPHLLRGAPEEGPGARAPSLVGSTVNKVT